MKLNPFEKRIKPKCIMIFFIFLKKFFINNYKLFLHKFYKNMHFMQNIVFESVKNKKSVAFLVFMVDNYEL